MPNRSSLVRRLAELRTGYTGETDSSVLPAVSSGLEPLTTGDRCLLMGMLSQDYVMRLLGENVVPPLTACIRHAVLPDGHSASQQEMEAGILLAASRAVRHLQARPNPDPEPTAQVFRMVRPQLNELVLHIEPLALAPLLLELLPRQADHDVVGVAGLRVRLHRRHIQLSLVDTPDATVQIANVSYRQWTAALAFVEAVAGPGFADLWGSGNEPQPLTAAEREMMAAHGRSGNVAAPLASSLLRRIRLLGSAHWLTANSTSRLTVVVVWQAGPSLATVATKLIHPILGLPGDSFQVLRLSQNQVAVSDYDHGREQEAPWNRATTLVLRQATDLNADAQQEVHRSGEVDVERAWARWSEVLCAPNPTRPARIETGPQG